MKIFEIKLFNSKLDLAGLALFLILAVLPAILGIGYALLYSTGVIGSLSDGFTIAYWKEVLTNNEIYYSFGFSAFIAGVAMLCTIFWALLGTLLFHRDIDRGFFSYIVYAPLSIPGIVAALFVIQMFSGAGLVSRISYQLGFIDSIRAFPSLINDQWGIGIIAAMMMLATPFFLIYFQSIYKSESLNKLTHLALSLGSSKITTAVKIKVPIILKRAFPTLLLYFIFMMGSYEIPLLLGQQSPQMVSVLTLRKLRNFNLMDIPEAYIIATIYLLIILSLIIFIFRKNRLAYDL